MEILGDDGITKIKKRGRNFCLFFLNVIPAKAMRHSGESRNPLKKQRRSL